jgi:hypothetical protein
MILRQLTQPLIAISGDATIRRIANKYGADCEPAHVTGKLIERL